MPPRSPPESLSPCALPPSDASLYIYLGKKTHLCPREKTMGLQRVNGYSGQIFPTSPPRKPRLIISKNHPEIKPSFPSAQATPTLFSLGLTERKIFGSSAFQSWNCFQGTGATPTGFNFLPVPLQWFWELPEGSLSRPGQ